MSKKTNRFIGIKIIDFIPATSGLIGKIALVSSFAFVWAQELSITSPNFVFENVRIEIIIGSIITLVMALILPNTAPAGTLAPLIVLIPTMVRFGVHPFVLSILVGIIGMISVKTKLFETLISLSGYISKTSLTLTFGISGVLLSVKKLISFFCDNSIPLFLLIFSLALAYLLLLKHKKNWLVIPVSAIVSVLISLLFGVNIDISTPTSFPNFNPFYWWNDMWGIGFGINLLTIIRTLPFAIFVVLLWAIDTISINAMLHANFQANETREEINLNNSFIIVSARNMIGGLCGGAQTSSLWRSFLIPLFMMKRPIRSASILLGILGLLVGITAIPVKILSFPPLIWTVLLFGIFIPFVTLGIKNIKNTENIAQKAIILLFSATGVFISPILTWVGAVCYEKIEQKLRD